MNQNNLPPEVIEAIEKEATSFPDAGITIPVIRATLTRGAQLYQQFATSCLEGEKWISIEERPPNTDGPVLCKLSGSSGSPNVVVLSCVGNIDGCWPRLYMDFPVKSYWEDWTDYVTHWMPLPAPPQSLTPKSESNVNE